MTPLSGVTDLFGALRRVRGVTEQIAARVTVEKPRRAGLIVRLEQTRERLERIVGRLFSGPAAARSSPALRASATTRSSLALSMGLPVLPWRGPLVVAMRLESR